jgi:DNA-binding LacI/PurR family transcriptional regulator
LGKPRILLKDVARASEVSVATVSRVARGSSSVGLATKKRVRAAASKLGFSFDQCRRNKALVFVLSNREMLHPVHSQILVGAEHHARALGWEMIFLVFHYDLHLPWKELHLPRVAQRGDVVRGVILSGTNAPNLLELLARKRIPFVVFGNNVVGDWRHSDYDAAYFNEILGGFDVARYLQNLGHRDIWFVGNCRLPWFARAYEGYRRAMEEAGLPPRRSEIYSEDHQQVGYLAAKALLDRGEPVTAIFAAQDAAASGVYKAVRDCGLRIPDDVSVVGCNDSYGAILYPPLTTIRSFPMQLGECMVDLVLNRIANPELPIQQFTIPMELIKRESCRSIPQVPESAGHAPAQIVRPA